MDENYDGSLPIAYINNQNPYAYCKGYFKNSINMSDKKTRLMALQRIQPTKVSFRMPLRHVEKEKEYLLSNAIEKRRKELIKRGFSILNVEYHDYPELLFEQNIDNEEILDIAIELKKMKLIFHQKRLRTKVGMALFPKVNEDVEYNLSVKKWLEIDNLGDSLIYCKLHDLYNKNN